MTEVRIAQRTERVVVGVDTHADVHVAAAERSGLCDLFDNTVARRIDLNASGAVRAVQVLEGLGDADALRLLQELARGAPGARLTEEAAPAVNRLTHRR